MSISMHNFKFNFSFLKMFLNVSYKSVNFSVLIWMMGAFWAFCALEGEGNLNFH